MKLRNELEHRILVLDGAMGTMIQRYKLTEKDYRGERFAQWESLVKGNNDLLVLTQPEIIRSIHTLYLEAGADIIETNTFNAQRISLEDYGMGELVREINLEAAKLARQAANEFTAQNPDKPRFVAGAVGPTNKTASMSPDVNNPAFRAVSFDDLVSAYKEQILGLIEGGVDVLLIETIFDTLNAKAAIFAAEEAMSELDKRVDLMISATVADTSGRTLSGQTIRAFLASIGHANILSIGLNCSFGAKDLKPYLQEINAYSPWFVSAYPNAGLPNQFGEYDETPETMAVQVKEYIDEQLVNIIGGCCGTSPDHIAAYQELIKGAKVRTRKEKNMNLELSGLELLEITSPPTPLLKERGDTQSWTVEGLNSTQTDLLKERGDTPSWTVEGLNSTQTDLLKERGNTPSWTIEGLNSTQTDLLKEKGDKTGWTDENKHANFTTDPFSWSLLIEKAKEMRHEPTKAEDALWDCVRNRKIDYKIRRQHIVNGFIADFICIEKKAIIEVDGGIHSTKEQRNHDKFRTEVLNSNGFNVLRFTNEEVLKNSYEVAKRIKSTLDILPSLQQIKNNDMDTLPPSPQGEGPGVR